MKVKVLWQISGLDLPNNTIGTIKLPDNSFTLTNIDTFRNNFFSPKLLSLYGKVSNDFPKNTAYAYSELDYSSSSIISETEEQLNQKIDKDISSTSGGTEFLLVVLWFVKDNSISLLNTYVDTGVLKSIQHKGKSIVSHSCLNVESNNYDSVLFNGGEIGYAGKIAQKISQILTTYSKILPPGFSIMSSAKMVNKTAAVIPNSSDYYKFMNQTCLGRAIYFLTIARRQEYIPYKIAFYTPILECLFSVDGDSTDINYKISERVAFYMYKEKQERLDIMDFIKKVYAIRSQFIHGQHVNKKDSDLRQLLIKFDQLLRDLLTKIILHDADLFLNSNRNDFIKNMVINYA